MNLQSSVNKLGDSVTQIITCKTGVKKTIRGVLTDTIQQGQFTKFLTKDGRMVMINDNNIFCIECFQEHE